MNAAVQVGLYFALLAVLAVPLGGWLARCVEASPASWERWLLRHAGVDAAHEMTWPQYARAVLTFNLTGALVLYALQRLQGVLPLNPQHFAGVGPALAFNTAVSFATNTNWQAYSGESTLSVFTQMVGLTVQNFVSAGTGLAVLWALIRGFIRHEHSTIGNFWLDLTRSTVRVLIPLSLVLALALISQGVVQTFDASVTTQSGQIIAVGPVASQVAIKQLGSNGGGYFNANSAHPFENPTPVSNLLEMLAILLLAAALPFTLGRLVKDARQGWALVAVMVLLVLPALALTVWAESQANPLLTSLGVDQQLGNFEGKETRLGVVNSALWAVVTTAASSGSVNAMHDSFMPLGALGPLWLMQLGEIVFGGVGSGLYGLLVYAILAVFVSGLMVGRTPEYLGKKIEPTEMKMACLVVLLPSAAALVGTAVACVSPEGVAALGNPGAHGFTEMLYAFSSAANNNGSAFAGLNASSTFYCVALGLCMLVGRYWVIVPVLALAGSLARKRKTAVTAGTLPTHTPLFVVLLFATIVLVGALTFVPALALGPLVEHLELFRRPS